MVTSYRRGMGASFGNETSSGEKSNFCTHDPTMVVTVSSENKPPMHDRGPAPNGV